TITENEIIEAIDTLQGDKTILIIAHRLTTVRHCDRIIVLDAGRIAESGTWDELVKNGHLFHKLAAGNTRDHAG
ncbi:MAG: ABC transporter ATP-binding protein, partial [Pseudomonadota bacterium]|nr:ABC transporter ATP-binding protein [Pseudomonadota bacterium]